MFKFIPKFFTQIFNGKNNVIVKNEKYDKVSYDFWKVTYHDIDFINLHEVK